MKTKFAALIASVCVASSAMAGSLPGQADFESRVFANRDVKAVELSQAEMKETEGAWVANAIGGVMGGVGGYFGYMASSVASGTYNRNAHLAAIGTGAAIGAFNPINGARSFIAGARGMALGTASGAINGYASSTGTTHIIRR